MSQEVKNSDHFEGKDALGHIAQVQAKGILTSSEIHGIESPGHITAGADSARQTAIILLLFCLILESIGLPSKYPLELLSIFIVSWTVWKGGRSAWLGWSKLERMHRILEQEKWEIEHHRDQERQELKELYEAKGFKGKLLDEVVEVLMSDDDRLLRVMVEEELRLTLENYQHPLKQALGAAIGTLLSASILGIGYYIWPRFGVWIAALTIVGFSAAIYAKYERNRMIPAIIWNLGLAIVTAGIAFFLLEYFSQ